MQYLVFAAMLCLFWLLLSGHYTPLFLSLGGLSVLLVVWVLRRMDRVDGEPSFPRLSLSLVHYGLWLLWSVVKANVDVARRVWDPELPIHPRWSRLDTQLSSNMEKAFYANCITLVPGTLTTDVREDHFMVHSLSEEGIEELKTGMMERRIRRLRL